MSVWFEAARVAAGVNVVLLVALGVVWGRNYLDHGARHTLMLLAFATFLFVENALWVYFYTFVPGFAAWFTAAGTNAQVGLTMLCGLETIALVFIAREALR
jgi:hypothetical protein